MFWCSCYKNLHTHTNTPTSNPNPPELLWLRAQSWRTELIPVPDESEGTAGLCGVPTLIFLSGYHFSPDCWAGRWLPFNAWVVSNSEGCCCHLAGHPHSQFRALKVNGKTPVIVFSAGAFSWPCLKTHPPPPPPPPNARLLEESAQVNKFLKQIMLNPTLGIGWYLPTPKSQAS